MALKKAKKVEAGCPVWLATYGDMVTNLLVFFVLLLSMSEIKQDEKFMEFMQAIQEAFGYVGGMKHVPVEDALDPKNVPLAQMLVVPIDPERLSKSPDEGVVGKHETVTRARPTERYDEGGRFDFGELSAELTAEEEGRVAGYAEKVRGLRTQLEVRGHCNPRPVAGAGFRNHLDLAYQRARLVAEALVRHGVDERRILIVAAGSNEPITTGNYDRPGREENDLVQIMQIPRTVDEFGT